MTSKLYLTKRRHGVGLRDVRGEERKGQKTAEVFLRGLGRVLVFAHSFPKPFDKNFF
jgi:hypothetical protein